MLKSGGYGDVYRVVHKGEINKLREMNVKYSEMQMEHETKEQQEYVVVKQSKNSTPYHILSFQRECNVISMFYDHPYIAEVYGIVTNEHEMSGIVMKSYKEDLCHYIERKMIDDNGNSLNKIMLEIDFETSLMQIHDILSMFLSLYQANIVYRDYKIQNILVDENNRCRLTDFGTTKLRPEEMRIKRKGKIIDGSLDMNDSFPLQEGESKEKTRIQSLKDKFEEYESNTTIASVGNAMVNYIELNEMVGIAVILSNYLLKESTRQLFKKYTEELKQQSTTEKQSETNEKSDESTSDQSIEKTNDSTSEQSTDKSNDQQTKTVIKDEFDSVVKKTKNLSSKIKEELKENIPYYSELPEQIRKYVSKLMLFCFTMKFLIHTQK